MAGLSEERAADVITGVLRRGTVADLTLTVAEDLPCWWPTHLPFQHKIWNWFQDGTAGPVSLRSRCGPYQTRWMAIDEHTGTHFDAPPHFIPPEGSGLPNAGPAGAISGDKVPVEQFFGGARVVDARGVSSGAGPGVSPYITASYVRRWEQDHGTFQKGDIVLFWTGWDRYYRPGAEGKPYVEDSLVYRSGPGWPAPDVDAAELLLERGVRCMGTDGPSMGSAHDGGPVHVAALKEGAVFIEGLTGLASLPESGALFMFLPLKIAGSTGSCGRAIAIL